MLRMGRIMGEVLRSYMECVKLFMADCESEMIVTCECEM